MPTQILRPPGAAKHTCLTGAASTTKRWKVTTRCCGRWFPKRIRRRKSRGRDAPPIGPAAPPVAAACATTTFPTCPTPCRRGELCTNQWVGGREAAGDYRASLVVNPADQIIGDWLAYACDHAGLYGEEETVLKAQIARFANSYRLSQLGGLYYRLGRWNEARETLHKALTAPQSKTGATADLGLAQRQYDEAFVRTLPMPSKDHTIQKQ